MAEKATAPERPRHVLFRASLRNAAAQDTELQAFARPGRSEDNHRALELLRAIAESISPIEGPAAGWDHSNSRHWLWNTEAEREAFATSLAGPCVLRS